VRRHDATWGILNTWNAKGDERFNGGVVFSKTLGFALQ
jgi:hypothetical protein